MNVEFKTKYDRKVDDLQDHRQFFTKKSTYYFFCLNKELSRKAIVKTKNDEN